LVSLLSFPQEGAFRYKIKGTFVCITSRNYIDKSRFETLRQKQCEGLLKCLATKGHGYVSEAAKRLTPFVRAVYDGRNYTSTLAVESLSEISAAQLDSSRVLELCSEL
jgi:hypothetical protein